MKGMQSVKNVQEHRSAVWRHLFVDSRLFLFNGKSICYPTFELVTAMFNNLKGFQFIFYVFTCTALFNVFVYMWWAFQRQVRVFLSRCCEMSWRISNIRNLRVRRAREAINDIRTQLTNVIIDVCKIIKIKCECEVIIIERANNQPISRYFLCQRK